MIQIGIVGSRRRDSQEDYDIVEKTFLAVYEKGDIIVSGGCSSGADKFAEMIADKYHIPKRIYEADWERFGRGAGFMRNTDIAKISNILIACVADDRKGGTEDTIRKFQRFHSEGKLILC